MPSTEPGDTGQPDPLEQALHAFKVGLMDFKPIGDQVVDRLAYAAAKGEPCEIVVRYEPGEPDGLIAVLGVSDLPWGEAYATAADF